MNKRRFINLLIGPVLLILFINILPSSVFATFSSRAAIGLQPQYMLKEGWKMTVIVIALMTVVCSLMLKFWPAFSTV